MTNRRWITTDSRRRVRVNEEFSCKYVYNYDYYYEWLAIISIVNF